jgi:putative nucleotidyltransferase with HDIG domain
MEDKVASTNHYRLYDNLMALAMAVVGFFTVFVFSFFKEMSFVEVSRAVLFLFLLTFITVFYIKSSKFQCTFKHYRWVIAAGFCLSVVFSFINGIFDIYFLWITGAVLVASFVDISLSFFIAVLSIFLMSVSTGDPTEAMVYNFIMCAIVIMVSKFFKGIKNLIYVCIILISCNVTLKLITCSFDINRLMDSGLIYDIATLLGAVLFVFILHSVLSKDTEEKINVPAKESFDAVETIIAMEEIEKNKEQINMPSLADENTSAKSPVIEETKAETTKEAKAEVKEEVIAEDKSEEKLITELTAILAPEYKLLAEFKEKCPDIYAHSLKCASISAKAAALIDADDLLARAGAMYHEIGKTVSANYIKEGIILAKKNNFPVEVINIIKEHNSKVGAPKSPESTIVMLSDSILSSLEFMNSTSGEKKISLSPEKLVNGIFDSRLQTGILDSCGISLADYKTLKTFYIKAVKEGGMA